MRLHTRHALVLVALGGALLLAGCGASDAFFPEDYATTFTPVASCVYSLDHDLGYVTIYVSPEAEADYCMMAVPGAPPAGCGDGSCTVPEGTLIVKEEYSDSACTDLTGYAAMRKEAPGEGSEGMDWTFQHLNKHFRSKGLEIASCVSCHSTCGPMCVGWEMDSTCREVRCQ